MSDNWESDSSSESENNNPGEYRIFNVRGTEIDDSSWAVNEAIRKRTNNKNNLVRCKDELTEFNENLCEESKYTKPQKLIRLNGEITKLPSKAVIAKHNLTHLPHEKWCVHCVEGRAVKDQSLTVSKTERNKRTGIIVQVDFFEFHKSG